MCIDFLFWWYLKMKITRTLVGLNLASEWRIIGRDQLTEERSILFFFFEFEFEFVMKINREVS